MRRRIGGQQGGGVGADRIECDKAQIEQPGEADFQIQPHAHKREQTDQHHHLADEIAGDIGEQEHHQSKQHVTRNLDILLLPHRQTREHLFIRSRCQPHTP